MNDHELEKSKPYIMVELVEYIPKPLLSKPF